MTGKWVILASTKFEDAEPIRVIVRLSFTSRGELRTYLLYIYDCPDDYPIYLKWTASHTCLISDEYGIRTIGKVGKFYTEEKIFEEILVRYKRCPDTVDFYLTKEMMERYTEYHEKCNEYIRMAAL